ncbi:MAG: flagellar motor protein MotB [Nitriliruptoraceae bacterium]|nr:flagellar motor protein MotB [Nitriliruptoraceae bacterium]
MAASSSGGRPGRRRRRDAEDDGQTWLTTYADAITLLMAFFVLLYAMSEIDTIKFTAFLEGLRTPFGNEAGEGILPDSDGLQPEDQPRVPTSPPEAPLRVEDLEQAFNIRLDGPTTEAADGHPSEQLQQEFADRDLDVEEVLERIERMTAAHDQLDQVATALGEALTEEELELYVELRREERGLVVSISSDDVLFALGSTTINELGRDVIATVADVLDGFPNPLMVEGHTDDIPLDRNGYTNWNLSTDRAVAVLQRMIEEHDLPPDRVGAVGYGEYHPLESNGSDEGRARNRRVDIVVLIEEDEL